MRTTRGAAGWHRVWVGFMRLPDATGVMRWVNVLKVRGGTARKVPCYARPHTAPPKTPTPAHVAGVAAGVQASQCST